MIGFELAAPAAVKLRIRRRWIISSAVVAGLLFWVSGAVALSAGHGSWGAILRGATLLLAGVVVLRRPTLLAWTFFAMLAGIELGLDFPRIAAQAQLPGDLFLRLVRMVVAPLILTSIPAGIAAHSHLRSVGRVAVKVLIYFEVVTTAGLIIGSLAGIISGAGSGVTLPASSHSSSLPTQQVPHGWQQTLLDLFPENIAQAVAENRILQVVIFAILFGIALATLPEEKRAPLANGLKALTSAISQMVRIITYLTPLAAGSALAYTVATTGFASLVPLAKLVITCFIALAFFCLVVVLPLLLFFRIPLRRFAVAVSEPAAIGFATGTSEAALPLAMERMEELGVPGWIVSFVIPLGYSFNMDGSSVYMSLAAVFAAQAAGIHLTFGQHVGMLALLVLASKGMAGVPKTVFVILLTTASAVHLPTAPILMILGVDTLMDMGRTAVNVMGNCAASAVIAKSEDKFAFSGTANVDN
ncbi:MAG: dicarboxylate/amino acid:cation symporter [Terracidiphilus sp.]